jgi:hypothetical protein
MTLSVRIYLENAVQSFVLSVSFQKITAFFKLPHVAYGNDKKYELFTYFLWMFMALEPQLQPGI